MTDEEKRQAEEEAKKKEAERQPSLIARAIKGIKDINLWDSLHPQGTGSTQRGFNNIYPTPGK